MLCFWLQCSGRMLHVEVFEYLEHQRLNLWKYLGHSMWLLSLKAYPFLVDAVEIMLHLDAIGLAEGIGRQMLAYGRIVPFVVVLALVAGRLNYEEVAMGLLSDVRLYWLTLRSIKRGAPSKREIRLNALFSASWKMGKRHKINLDSWSVNYSRVPGIITILKLVGKTSLLEEIMCRYI